MSVHDSLPAAVQMHVTKINLARLEQLHLRLITRKGYWYSPIWKARDSRICVAASDLRAKLSEDTKC